MGKIRIVNNIINSNYDLQIVLFNKSLYKNRMLKNNYKLKQYINSKYKNIKEGDIIVTPGFNIKKDIMFIKIPINNKNKLINICNRVLKLIMINEYKEILIPNYNIYKYKYINKKIYSIINKYIENKDINIDLTKN